MKKTGRAFNPYSRNKYGAKRTNGFASGLENKVHEMLLLQVKSGQLSDLRCQHCVELTDAKIRCKIDFSVTNLKTGQLEFHEAKGQELDRWIIIKKLWKFYGPAALHVWKSNRQGIYLAELIIP